MSRADSSPVSLVLNSCVAYIKTFMHILDWKRTKAS